MQDKNQSQDEEYPVQAYAMVLAESGLVVSVIVWDGRPGYNPGDQYILIQSDTARIGWTYRDGEFVPPPVIPPTPEEILLRNQQTQTNLVTMAAQEMAPILVSLQLGDATDDETVIAKEWQSYYRALKAVDLTVEDIQWPERPQQG